MTQSKDGWLISFGYLPVRTLLASGGGAIGAWATGGNAAEGAIIAAMVHLYNSERAEKEYRKAIKNEAIRVSNMSVQEFRDYFGPDGFKSDDPGIIKIAQLDLVKQLQELGIQSLREFVEGYMFVGNFPLDKVTKETVYSMQIEAAVEFLVDNFTQEDVGFYYRCRSTSCNVELYNLSEEY